MKRSGIFITVLLSLFMFQSLWNVAAAFCDHENTYSASNVVVPHFGHHLALNCEQDQHHHLSHSYNSEFQYSDKYNDLMLDDFLNHLGDDHRDHLPSFAHFIISDVQGEANQPKLSAYSESNLIDWKNLYQSPHLFPDHPPPVDSPL